jgi:hypothetical protein
MRHILHILTRPGDSLGAEIAAGQKNNPDAQVEVIDLRAPQPDYKELLQKIFDADSIQTW